MSLVRGIVIITLVLFAGCSRSEAKSTATVDESWSHAYTGGDNGWWKDWDSSLGGKAPFGVGTRFEIETLGAHGIRQTRVIEVRGIKPTKWGAFVLELTSTDGSSFRSELPRRLLYSPGKIGWITTRNEKLLSVTVPAGTFAAGRLWTSERVGYLVYERDEWVVPELPVAVQSWSRPVNAKELYNPPADGNVPPGTTLERLVRIERR
jgi:hypothetical protein